MKSVDRTPSLDEQIETLRQLGGFVWRPPAAPMRLSDVVYHQANLLAAINTLLAEKERRLSPQEALARLVP